MPTAASKTFTAALERAGGRPQWTIIRVPLDVHKVWGVRGQLRVKGEIRAMTTSLRRDPQRPAFHFRAVLRPTGRGTHFILVTRAMRCGAGLQPGMMAHVRMEPDTEKREVRVPAELARALAESKRLKKYYAEALNESTRRAIAQWVGEGKQAETRRRRAEQIAVRLMEVMEAERGDLPPVLRLALERNPRARAGWERMSLSMRRFHLFGITHYRNPESRARRVEKAVAEMVAYADRREGR